MVSERIKLLVTNNLGQYGLDVVRVMAMVSGTSYRFRYYERWLPTLVESIKNGQIKTPCESLIVLRDFQTGKFVPIRYVRITEIVVLGDTYYIVFEPDKFVNLSDDAEKRKQQLQKFNKALEPLITENGKYPNTPNDHFQNLFCEITDLVPDIEIDTGQEKSDMKSWANLVSELKEWPFYQGTGFYRVFSITSASEECDKPYFAENEKLDIVLPGKIYALRLLHIQHDAVSNESTIDQRIFKLSSNDERLVIDKNESVIKSRYDVAELKFHLDPDFVGKDTTTLEMSNVDGDGKDLLYPQYIPITINAGFGKIRISKIMATVVLLFLWAVLRSGLILPVEMGLDNLVVVILVLTLSIPKDALSMLGLK